MNETADSHETDPSRWAAAFILIAIAAVATGARVSVALPGTPVPQSLQTVAVLLTGAALGAWLGGLAITLYVVLGALGLPVFADGASGTEHLLGPTAGYLLGFIASAALLGWWRTRGWCASLGPAFGGMALGHAVILVLGWVWLTFLVGPIDAFTQGVAPFVVGGLVKAAAAALVVVVVLRSVENRATR